MILFKAMNHPLSTILFAFSKFECKGFLLLFIFIIIILTVVKWLKTTLILLEFEIFQFVNYLYFCYLHLTLLHYGQKRCQVIFGIHLNVIHILYDKL